MSDAGELDHVPSVPRFMIDRLVARRRQPRPDPRTEESKLAKALELKG